MGPINGQQNQFPEEFHMPSRFLLAFKFTIFALVGVFWGVLGVMPLSAKNFAVPDKDPTVTLTLPDNWKTEEIEFGYSAVSPGKDVFFSVEFASVGRVDALMKTNEKWMKENGIKMVTPQKVETTINGIPATVLQFETTDENGQTTLEFIMMPGGKNRMIMLTLWGSDEERKKHGAAIDSIMSSVKAIN
jgi:hypothetical protein